MLTLYKLPWSFWYFVHTRKPAKCCSLNKGLAIISSLPFYLHFLPFWPVAQSGYVDSYTVVTDFSLKSRISVHVRPSLGIFCPRSQGWDLNPGVERVMQTLQLFHLVPLPFPTKPLQPPCPGCFLLVSIRMCFGVLLSAEFCLCERSWDQWGGVVSSPFQLSLLNPPKWLQFHGFQQGP